MLSPRHWLLLLSPALALFNPLATLALPVADATLGTQVNENQLIPNLFEIQGGTTTGQNLFHSFESFNINTGEAVYFFSPAEINHIFSRVTGGNRSEIDGILGTFGSNADLFLMNPNGVVFGPNASLDVQGSFMVTTANAIGLGPEGVFSATDPSSDRLLTVNPSAFFFNELGHSREVVVQAQARRPSQADATINRIGLEVPNGETLLLLGEDVTIDNGFLTARGGQIEIGAISGTGFVALGLDGHLQIPRQLQQGSVTFTNEAVGFVRADRNGTIDIQAGEINIIDGSSLLAGIDEGLGTSDSQAGNIFLNATGDITIANSSVVRNDILAGGTGNSGDFILLGDNLFVRRSFLGTSGFGLGNAGDIKIQVQDQVIIDSIDGMGQAYSFVASIIGVSGQGNTGNVSISTGGLEARGEVIIGNFTGGLGNTGDVVIISQDHISLEGNSRVVNQILPSSGGQAGDIRISAGSLDLRNGSQLNTVTFGQGNAGNININVRNHTSFDESLAASVVFSSARGQAGDIQISTGSLELRNGSELNTATQGQGNAGNIRIQAVEGIMIRDYLGDFSKITSAVEENAEGQGGDIFISAESLDLVNGASINSGTSGIGDAGNITIHTDNHIIVRMFDKRAIDENRLFYVNNNVFSGVQESGQGNAGSINISTGIFEALESTRISSSTLATGNAGDVRIDAHDRVIFDDSNLFLRVNNPNAIGNGGKLEISTGSLTLLNGSQIDTSTFGDGEAGNIDVNASRSVTVAQAGDDGRASAIFSTNGDTEELGTGRSGTININTPFLTVNTGGVIDSRTFNDKPGGDINITVDRLQLLNGGQIFTTSVRNGPAGTVTVNAGESVTISGTNPDYFRLRDQFGTGRLGVLSERSSLSVFSEAIGAAGNIILNTPLLNLSDQGTISAESNAVSGGNIFINTDRLLLRRNSTISATAGLIEGAGDGGNITINAPFIIAIPEENSDITANAFQGSGGRVNITAQGVFGIEPRPNLTPLSDITASSELGVNGVVTLNTLDTGFIENSLTDLPEVLTNPETLVANSCIVRRQESTGRFVITGGDSLPEQPDNSGRAIYALGEVKPIADDSPETVWQPGMPIVEPDGVYQLADGRLVMSRECG
jgi:filamentous hemagglutinin family protein